MAIYHYSLGYITRSKKGAAAKAAGARGSTAGDRRVSIRSVVAAAAYRAGECLTLVWEKNPFTRFLLAADAEKALPETEGTKASEIMVKSETTFDYSKKKDVAYREIMAPADAPAWVFDRQTLWNRAENAEKRVDSVLAADIDAALPKELGLEQCKHLVQGFIEENFTARGMVADVSFHGMGSHNPHIHILLTTRAIEGEGFAATKWGKDGAWKPKISNMGTRNIVGESTLEQERESWAKHCNAALDAAGEEARIDHRSFKDQGIEHLKPTFHLGKNAHHAEKRGKDKTRIASRLNVIKAFNRAMSGVLNAWKQEVNPQPFYTLPFLNEARDKLNSLLKPQLSMALPQPSPYLSVLPREAPPVVLHPVTTPRTPLRFPPEHFPAHLPIPDEALRRLAWWERMREGIGRGIETARTLATGTPINRVRNVFREALTPKPKEYER
jgi:hypothetical protein